MRLPLVEDPRPLEPIAKPSSKTWPVLVVIGMAMLAALAALYLASLGWLK